MLLLAATFAWADPGDRQSPINIETNAASTQPLAAIVPTYASNVTLSLFHTFDPNHAPLVDREWATLRANVPAGSFVTVGQTRYNLLQFHFHTPSEHQVNNKSAPMEIHFMHLREGASPCDPDALLVIGARIIEGGTHRELNKIFGLPTLPTNTTPPISIANFNLTAVLPGLQHSWRYVGSLTAPASFGATCSEPEGTVENQLSTDIFPETSYGSL